jgi:hypothetical protein
MTPSQIFLAYKEASGIKNAQAFEEVARAHNELYPHKGFSISISSISRLRNGANLDVAKTPEFLKALAKAAGVKDDVDPQLGLEKFTELLAVKAVLANYKAKSHTINRFDAEAISLLTGVWQQISLSTAESDGSKNLQIRIALRHIYRTKGLIKTQTLGPTTNSTGDLHKFGNYIQISEKNSGSAFSEKGEYIYEYPEYLDDDLKNDNAFINGASLIIVRTKERKDKHIFAGKTIMRKRDNLTKRYTNDDVKFMSDADDLRRVYCWRGAVDSAEKPALANDIAALIERLKLDGRSGINNFAYICV